MKDQLKGREAIKNKALVLHRHATPKPTDENINTKSWITEGENYEKEIGELRKLNEDNKQKMS